MFSLLYPAVLGTLLFGILTTPVNNWIDRATIGLVAAYFLTQFAESFQKTKTEYRWPDFIFDCVELATMIVIFATFGFFTQKLHWIETVTEHSDLVRWPAIGFAFLLPPLGRIVQNKKGTDHNRLMALSGAAMFGCAIAFAGSLSQSCGAIASWLGIAVIALAMAAYIRTFKAIPA